MSVVSLPLVSLFLSCPMLCNPGSWTMWDSGIIRLRVDYGSIKPARELLPVRGFHCLRGQIQRQPGPDPGPPCLGCQYRMRQTGWNKYLIGSDTGRHCARCGGMQGKGGWRRYGECSLLQAFTNPLKHISTPLSIFSYTTNRLHRLWLGYYLAA